jgi:hypothetical protein
VSRFLLRCTITAACAVSLSSAPALAQSDSAARAVIDRAMPTIMAPAAFATPTNVTAMLAPASVPSPGDRIDAPRPINEDASSVVRRRAAFGRPAVLMITGGALLLTGLLVDGDASSILIIAGAGIGGYGLYLHLQSPNARLRR